jgi:hypothetical protein
MSLKLAVVGSCNFADAVIMSRVLDDYRAVHSDFTIITGAAKGADTLAAAYAVKHGLPLIQFAPPAADVTATPGATVTQPSRGRQIVDAAGEMVAFWEESRGTKVLIELARKKGIAVRVVTPLGSEYWY